MPEKQFYVFAIGDKVLDVRTQSEYEMVGSVFNFALFNKVKGSGPKRAKQRGFPLLVPIPFLLFVSPIIVSAKRSRFVHKNKTQTWRRKKDVYIHRKDL